MAAKNPEGAGALAVARIRPPLHGPTMRAAMAAVMVCREAIVLVRARR